MHAIPMPVVTQVINGCTVSLDIFSLIKIHDSEVQGQEEATTTTAKKLANAQTKPT